VVAYFVLGVEYGIAAAAANGFTKASPTQRAIAERIVQDVLRTGVARDDAVRAAMLHHRRKSRRRHCGNTA